MQCTHRVRLAGKSNPISQHVATDGVLSGAARSRQKRRFPRSLAAKWDLRPASLAAPPTRLEPDPKLQKAKWPARCWQQLSPHKIREAEQTCQSNSSDFTEGFAPAGCCDARRRGPPLHQTLPVVGQQLTAAGPVVRGAGILPPTRTEILAGSGRTRVPLPSDDSEPPLRLAKVSKVTPGGHSKLTFGRLFFMDRRGDPVAPRRTVAGGIPAKKHANATVCRLLRQSGRLQFPPFLLRIALRRGSRTPRASDPRRYNRHIWLFIVSRSLCLPMLGKQKRARGS